MKSRCITSEYLLKIYRNEVFSIRVENIRYAPYERKVWASIDILASISNAIAPRILGFTPCALPDRRWILNLAFTLLPDLEIFTGSAEIDDIVPVPLEFVENAAFFDPYVKISKRPIFSKTPETKNQEKQNKLRRRLLKKERRVDYLQSESRRIYTEISEIQAGIDIVGNN